MLGIKDLKIANGMCLRCRHCSRDTCKTARGMCLRCGHCRRNTCKIARGMCLRCRHCRRDTCKTASGMCLRCGHCSRDTCKIANGMCLRCGHYNNFGVISKYMVNNATNLDMVNQNEHIGGKKGNGSRMKSQREPCYLRKKSQQKRLSGKLSIFYKGHLS